MGDQKQPGREPEHDEAADTTLWDRGSAPADKIVGVLVAVRGTLAGQSYVLYDGENILGRGEGCSVQFPDRDRRISRRHAAIVCHGGHFAIEPLGANPTALDGVDLSKGPLADLADGATITMGWTTFVFRAVA